MESGFAARTSGSRSSRATEHKYGKISVLANSAGISGRPAGMTVQIGNIAGVPLAEQTLESWNRITEVNATGVFLGTKSVIPAMQAAPRRKA